MNILKRLIKRWFGKIVEVGAYKVDGIVPPHEWHAQRLAHTYARKLDKQFMQIFLGRD